MNFLDLNDDVKFIISKHSASDFKINRHFMTKPDNDSNCAETEPEPSSRTAR